MIINRNRLNLKNRIHLELDAEGVDNEKARRFFEYILLRILPDLQIENLESERNIIKRYVRVLPKADFPFFKSNQKLLILPCDVIVSEVLYSDRDLSMFFMIYAGFYLKLQVLHEVYPSWFEFLSIPPYLVPGPLTARGDTHVDAIIQKYEIFVENRNLEEQKKGFVKEKGLLKLIRELSGSYYLPYGTDFSVYNKPIFDDVLSSR